MLEPIDSAITRTGRVCTAASTADYNAFHSFPTEDDMGPRTCEALARSCDGTLGRKSVGGSTLPAIAADRIGEATRHVFFRVV
jgi:hypothetical protein